MAKAPITSWQHDVRVLLAVAAGRAMAGGIRALLFSGGRLLLWADALAVCSARVQDLLLPPSAIRPAPPPAASQGLELVEVGELVDGGSSVESGEDEGIGGKAQRPRTTV